MDNPKTPQPEGTIETSAEQSAAEAIALATNEKLTLGYLRTVVETVPHFVDAAIEAIRTCGKLALEAGNSQSEALETLRFQIGTQERMLMSIGALSSRMDSEQGRIKIAEMLFEAFKITAAQADMAQKMNDSNNRTWIEITSGVLKTTAGVVGAGVLLLGAAATYGQLKK